MQTVKSKDGTPIAFWKSGSGPALLLVHGAVADHSTTWRAVVPLLEKKFTVYAMDRRGRGGSGDGPDYSLQREVEDVVAVAESIEGPVHVLGHSFGAIVTFAAAPAITNLDHLILYETVSLKPKPVDPKVLARLEALREAGDYDGLLVTMFRDMADIPPEQIEMMRSQEDAWKVRLGNAPTVPRELRAGLDHEFQPEGYRKLQTPTLLMVGGESPDWELESANAIAEVLPDARVVELEGQGHLATYTAPEAFVEQVVSFLQP